MHTFSELHLEKLRKYLELPNGVPPHDVFEDIFSRVVTAAVGTCFKLLTDSIKAGEGTDHVVALDGKTVRRCEDREQYSGKEQITSIPRRKTSPVSWRISVFMPKRMYCRQQRRICKLLSDMRVPKTKGIENNLHWCLVVRLCPLCRSLFCSQFVSDCRRLFYIAPLDKRRGCSYNMTGSNDCVDGKSNAAAEGIDREGHRSG